MMGEIAFNIKFLLVYDTRERRAACCSAKSTGSRPAGAAADWVCSDER